MRRVISLWLPRFPTDRLSRRRPELRTAPFVTVAEGRAGESGAGLRGGGAGRGSGHVMRVAAANRAAEGAAGIVPGLALSDARARLPSLGTVPADLAGDQRALAALADWCTRWTPWTACDAPDLVSPPASHHAIWLDITGCAHLFGGEAALVTDLVARLARFGYAARAGLADTPGAAWAASHYGAREPVRIIKRGGTRRALAKLPVAALRLEPALVEELERLGLGHIGALAALPRKALARRFGAAVLTRLDQAFGRVPEPLSPRPPTAPQRVHLAYAEPIAHRDAVAAGTERLLARLAARLAEAGLGVRRLVLALYRADGGVARVSVGTSAPVRAPRHLMRLIDERLDEAELGFGVDLMVLEAPHTAPLDAAQPTLDGVARAAEAARADALGLLIDRLGNRFGLAQVHVLAPEESHWPERAQTSAPPFAPAAAAAWPAVRGRPIRLLARPEAIEAVAMVPDDPPVMFRWRRVMHRVVKADGPERIAAEWWRGTQPPAAATNELRDYYRVEDAEGRRFWVYRDAPYVTGGKVPDWWLHGLFA